jgi:hypothetical protein
MPKQILLYLSILALSIFSCKPQDPEPAKTKAELVANGWVGTKMQVYKKGTDTKVADLVFGELINDVTRNDIYFNTDGTYTESLYLQAYAKGTWKLTEGDTKIVLSKTTVVYDEYYRDTRTLKILSIDSQTIRFIDETNNFLVSERVNYYKKQKGWFTKDYDMVFEMTSVIR